MRYVVLALLAMSLTVPAEAGKRSKKSRTCKSRVVNVHRASVSKCTTGKCGTSTQTIEKTKTKTITKESRLQAWCREECRLQSLNGMGHYRRTPAGCYFCGVGVGNNSCRPHSGLPKASVTAYGYTTRVW
jgi:hypothetical protein